MRIKRFLPSGLFGRAFLIVALPVLLLQGVVAYTLIQRHFDAITRQLAESAAQEIAFAADRVAGADTDAEARSALARIGTALGLELRLTRTGPASPTDERRLFDFSGGVVADALRDRLGPTALIDTTSLEKRILVRLPTAKGDLVARIDRSRVTFSNPHQLFVVIGLSSLALLAVAIQFLRNQVRPIRELAQAAEAFGMGRKTPFRPRGADEVRRAGGAFLEMRARIDRHIANRTRMLSGVSHDMRTPLTRMKLALEMMEPSPERAELADDIAQMETMLDAFLAFARGEAAEPDAPADPGALAREAAGDLNHADAVIRVEIAEGLAPVRMRRNAVRRALGNLLANAARHARHARLRAQPCASGVEFVIEDDGPGIAPENREAALAPFSRLDAARNQDEGGGVGLGLSIAQDIARAHGGRLTLEQSDELGGLRVRMTLPR